MENLGNTASQSHRLSRSDAPPNGAPSNALAGTADLAVDAGVVFTPDAQYSWGADEGGKLAPPFEGAEPGRFAVLGYATPVVQQEFERFIFARQALTATVQLAVFGVATLIAANPIVLSFDERDTAWNAMWVAVSVSGCVSALLMVSVHVYFTRQRNAAATVADAIEVDRRATAVISRLGPGCATLVACMMIAWDVRICALTPAPEGTPDDRKCQSAMSDPAALCIALVFIMIKMPKNALASTFLLVAVAAISAALYFRSSSQHGDIAEYVMFVVTTGVFCAIQLTYTFMESAASRRHFEEVIRAFIARKQQLQRATALRDVTASLLPPALLRRLGPSGATTASTAALLSDDAEAATVLVTGVANTRDLETRFFDPLRVVEIFARLGELFDGGAATFPVDRAVAVGDVYVVTAGLIAGSRATLRGLHEYAAWQHTLDDTGVVPLRSVLVTGPLRGEVIGSAKTLRYHISGWALATALRHLQQLRPGGLVGCDVTHSIMAGAKVRSVLVEHSDGHQNLMGSCGSAVETTPARTYQSVPALENASTSEHSGRTSAAGSVAFRPMPPVGVHIGGAGGSAGGTGPLGESLSSQAGVSGGGATLQPTALLTRIADNALTDLQALQNSRENSASGSGADKSGSRARQPNRVPPRAQGVSIGTSATEMTTTMGTSHSVNHATSHATNAAHADNDDDDDDDDDVGDRGTTATKEDNNDGSRATLEDGYELRACLFRSSEAERDLRRSVANELWESQELTVVFALGSAATVLFLAIHIVDRAAHAESIAHPSLVGPIVPTVVCALLAGEAWYRHRQRANAPLLGERSMRGGWSAVVDGDSGDDDEEELETIVAQLQRRVALMLAAYVVFSVSLLATPHSAARNMPLFVYFSWLPGMTRITTVLPFPVAAFGGVGCVLIPQLFINVGLSNAPSKFIVFIAITTMLFATDAVAQRRRHQARLLASGEGARAMVATERLREVVNGFMPSHLTAAQLLRRNDEHLGETPTPDGVIARIGLLSGAVRGGAPCELSCHMEALVVAAVRLRAIHTAAAADAVAAHWTAVETALVRSASAADNGAADEVRVIRALGDTVFVGGPFGVVPEPVLWCCARRLVRFAHRLATATRKAADADSTLATTVAVGLAAADAVGGVLGRASTRFEVFGPALHRASGILDATETQLHSPSSNDARTAAAASVDFMRILARAPTSHTVAACVTAWNDADRIRHEAPAAESRRAWAAREHPYGRVALIDVSGESTYVGPGARGNTSPAVAPPPNDRGQDSSRSTGTDDANPLAAPPTA